MSSKTPDDVFGLYQKTHGAPPETAKQLYDFSKLKRNPMSLSVAQKLINDFTKDPKKGNAKPPKCSHSHEMVWIDNSIQGEARIKELLSKYHILEGFYPSFLRGGFNHTFVCCGCIGSGPKPKHNAIFQVNMFSGKAKQKATPLKGFRASPATKVKELKMQPNHSGFWLCQPCIESAEASYTKMQSFNRQQLQCKLYMLCKNCGEQSRKALKRYFTYKKQNSTPEHTHIPYCECGASMKPKTNKSGIYQMGYFNPNRFKCCDCRKTTIKPMNAYFTCPFRYIAAHPTGYRLCLNCAPNHLSNNQNNTEKSENAEEKKESMVESTAEEMTESIDDYFNTYNIDSHLLVSIASYVCETSQQLSYLKYVNSFFNQSLSFDSDRLSAANADVSINKHKSLVNRLWQQISRTKFPNISNNPKYDNIRRWDLFYHHRVNVILGINIYPKSGVSPANVSRAKVIENCTFDIEELGSKAIKVSSDDYSEINEDEMKVFDDKPLPSQFEWKLRCPVSAYLLTNNDDGLHKFCTVCDRNVYPVSNKDAATLGKYIDNNECVYFEETSEDSEFEEGSSNEDFPRVHKALTTAYQPLRTKQRRGRMKRPDPRPEYIASDDSE